MSVLATHRCFEIRRDISLEGKRFTEICYDMVLFENKITVKHDCYPLTIISDISYMKKRETETVIFLYLHTNRGVRTYYTREEPIALIDAYHKLNPHD